MHGNQFSKQRNGVSHKSLGQAFGTASHGLNLVRMGQSPAVFNL